ncbi:MAG: metallophosphoesterase [Candidatus Thiodiazotropha sp.]|jgi:Icc-related predicted phosphoesterase
MKVRLYSDLHIEFDKFEASSKGADVMVLAGDIDIGVRGVEWIKSLNFNCPVIYVLGNHEYYKNKYPSLIHKIKEAANGTNIHVLENDSIELDGVRFHGTTLWTNFELFGNPRIAGYECQQVMTDFKKIRKEPSYSKLRSIDVAIIHNQSLRWLSNSLRQSDSAVNIVVTHHAPSIKSVPDRYKGQRITAAYASDLSSFVAEHKPDYWLHGHVHSSASYHLDSCHVICNPRGYQGDLNKGFDPMLILNVAIV